MSEETYVLTLYVIKGDEPRQDNFDGLHRQGSTHELWDLLPGFRLHHGGGVRLTEEVQVTIVNWASKNGTPRMAQDLRRWLAIKAAQGYTHVAY